MKKLFLVSAFFLAALTLHAQILAFRTNPRAEIVLPENASAAERYAAEELQYWIQRITDAQLPIVRKVSAPEFKIARLLIGTAFAKGHFDADLAKIGSTDGFAVRPLKNADKVSTVCIFGTTPRGTLHGVYAYLERNTDIIWARPNFEFGTVFSKRHTLNAKKTNFISIPKSTLRGWGWTVHGQYNEFLWASRNLSNCFGTYVRSREVLDNAYPLSGGGHGLQLYVPPKKYFSTNPEFFPLIKGKRTPHGQLCFTCESMIPEYIKNLRADLDRKKEVSGVNFSITDGWGVCECENCLKDLKLDDGRVITSKDPAFRAAQYYRFVNRIARAIRESHPDKVLLVYAYIFAIYAPPFPLEDNVRVQYCPFGKDNKFPIFDESRNKAMRDHLLDWSKITGKVWLREYYGCAAEFPRPIEYTVKEDLLFCLKNNVREFNTEWPVDHSSVLEVWDVSAMTAWVIARLWWDPEQDVDALRSYYLERTYREGAEAMGRYFEQIRKNWYVSKFPAVYTDTANAMAKMYILDAGSEEKCRAALVEAEKTAQHPVSKLLIQRHRACFEKWMDAARKDKTMRANVPCQTADDCEDFDSPVWKNATLLSPMIVCQSVEKQKARFRTDVRLTHDRKNLYILFDNFADDMKTLPVSEPKPGVAENFPRGDIMEFFLADPQSGNYYQFAFDAGNKAVYDGRGYDSKWNCSWKRKIKLHADRWSAIVTIPLDEIGINITTGNKLLFQPIRGKYYNNSNGKRVREMSSWSGGFVHESASFGELTLNQN